MAMPSHWQHGGLLHLLPLRGCCSVTTAASAAQLSIVGVPQQKLPCVQVLACAREVHCCRILTSTFDSDTPWLSKAPYAPSSSSFVTRSLKRPTTTPYFCPGVATTLPWRTFASCFAAATRTLRLLVLAAVAAGRTAAVAVRARVERDPD